MSPTVDIPHVPISTCIFTHMCMHTGIPSLYHVLKKICALAELDVSFLVNHFFPFFPGILECLG